MGALFAEELRASDADEAMVRREVSVLEAELRYGMQKLYEQRQLAREQKRLDDEMRAQAVRRSEEQKRQEDVEMTNAVTKIQSHRRAQLGRRDVKEKKCEKERARLAKEAEQAALSRERERRALEQKLEEMQTQKRASTASKAVEKHQ